MRTSIAFRRYTYGVRILDAGVEVVAAAQYSPARVDVDRLRHAFCKAGRRVRAPEQAWTPKESRIAANMIRRWGVDKVLRAVDHFWWRYSQPVMDNEYNDQMVLFAAAMPRIVAEVENL